MNYSKNKYVTLPYSCCSSFHVSNRKHVDSPSTSIYSFVCRYLSVRLHVHIFTFFSEQSLFSYENQMNSYGFIEILIICSPIRSGINIFFPQPQSSLISTKDSLPQILSTVLVPGIYQNTWMPIIFSKNQSCYSNLTKTVQIWLFLRFSTYIFEYVC